MANNKMDKIINSRTYGYLKRITDLIFLNFIFCVISILSGLVLFFPGLVSLHHICYQMVRNEEYQPYKTFFKEIKNQWSFMWRLELLMMSLIALFIGAAYLYSTYIYHNGYDWFVWFGIIFEVVLGLIVFTILMHLMTFNNYFKNDTFFMMIRKSALIARVKIKRSLLMLGLFICFIIIFYLIPYFIPFIGFVVFIFTLEYINHNLYDKLRREEENLELQNNLENENVDKEKKGE